MRRNIIISEGNRPFWQLIIASLFFTCALICMYLFFMNIDLYATGSKVKGAVSILETAMILFLGGASFSGTKDTYFDFETKRYKPVYRVGPIKVGRCIKFKNIEYISVFKNSKEEFEVNLWYDRNKHLNISLLPDKEMAIKDGKMIARKLAIGLLDATIKNKSAWIVIKPIT